ncbi:hypothetical protein BASA50_007386 [Batrachochytrium salamandrivorans]|uniref:Bromo domain-containing protein n=1 Tax=Batrachochytrium salamandrivorans TaxID=1357716 RepID=A0ABQ8F7F1_9FUNG|nr:hypothetical protein BASA50_007386 [Batrachochytrium salamandrivorans]KAH9269137.1 hypothetical protein BASA83_008888 [Batrachochytrium salamandrivorans]
MDHIHTLQQAGQDGQSITSAQSTQQSMQQSIQKPTVLPLQSAKPLEAHPTPTLRLVSSQTPSLNANMSASALSGSSVPPTLNFIANTSTQSAQPASLSSPAISTSLTQSDATPKRLVKLSLSVKDPATTSATLYEPPVEIANASQDLPETTVTSLATTPAAGSKRRHSGSPTHAAATTSSEAFSFASPGSANEPPQTKIKKLKFTTPKATPEPLKDDVVAVSTEVTPGTPNATQTPKRPSWTPIPGTLKSYFTRMYQKLFELKDKRTSTRILSEPFLILPDKQEYPDYYQLIDRPIAFDRIKKKVEGSRYSSIETYKKDVNLIFKNCQQYNLPESQIFQDSVELQEYFKIITDNPIENLSPTVPEKKTPRRKSDIVKSETPLQQQALVQSTSQLKPSPKPVVDLTEQRTALISSIEKNDMKRFEQGLTLFDANTINVLHPASMFDSKFTWAPIHAAAYYGQPKMLDMLVEYGANVELQDTWYHGRPLAWAAFAGHIKICKPLIEKYGADKFAVNIHGQTAFDLLGDSQEESAWEILKVNDIAKTPTSHGRSNTTKSSNSRTPKARVASEETKTPLSKPASVKATTLQTYDNRSHTPVDTKTPASRAIVKPGQVDGALAQPPVQRHYSKQVTPSQTAAAAAVTPTHHQPQLTPQQQFQQHQALYMHAQQQHAQTPVGSGQQATRSRQSSSKAVRLSNVPQYMSPSVGAAATVPGSYTGVGNAAHLAGAMSLAGISSTMSPAIVPDNAFTTYTTQQHMSAPQRAIVTSIGIVSNEDKFRMVTPFLPDDLSHGFVGSCISVCSGVVSINIRVVLGSNPFSTMLSPTGDPVTTRYTCTGHCTSTVMLPSSVTGSSHPQLRLEPLSFRVAGGKTGSIQDVSATVYSGLNSFELIVVATAYATDTLQPLDEVHQAVLLAIYRQ